MRQLLTLIVKKYSRINKKRPHFCDLFLKMKAKLAFHIFQFYTFGFFHPPDYKEY